VRNRWTEQITLMTPTPGGCRPPLCAPLQATNNSPKLFHKLSLLVGGSTYVDRYFRPPPCLSHRKDFPQPRIMCFRVQMTSPLFTLFPELFSCFYYVFRVQMISVFYFQNVCLSALRLFSCLCSFKRGLKAYLIQ